MELSVRIDISARHVHLTRESADGFSWINVLVFAVMLGVSVLLLAAGIRKEVCRRKK